MGQSPPILTTQGPGPRLHAWPARGETPIPPEKLDLSMPRSRGLSRRERFLFLARRLLGACFAVTRLERQHAVAQDPRYRRHRLPR